MENDRDVYWDNIENKVFEGELEDQVAVVTGGGKGIGKAIVDMLLENRAHAVIVSRSTGREVAESRENCEFKSCNVRNAERCEEVIEEVEEKHGRIDILVPNAGTAWLTPIKEESEEFFDKVMETNFKGVRNFIAPAAEHLEKTNGNIVTVGSILGMPGNNLEGDSTYSAGDAAIIKYSEVAAEEFENVDVNCISPAYVDTDINQDMSEEALNEIVEKYKGRDTLLRPEEIADVAEHLIKSQMTQKNVVIDAGYTR
jgi:NAD(P)-dependent dehydrogenase (short-subunit alcohol dehydrogenase family)